MKDLKSSLKELSERGTHVGAEGLRQHVMLGLARDTLAARTPFRGWGIAAVAAAVTVTVIAIPLILFGGTDGAIDPTGPTDATQLMQPVNGTESVAMTSDGSLWHGYLDGLRRWDPTTGGVIVYTEIDGLPSRNTHLLGVAPDDTLWAMSGGRLVRFDGTWTVESIPELEELTEWGSNVGALEIAPNGDVLLAVGRDHLIRYDGSEATVIEPPRQITADPWAGSLAVAPDGTIWAVLESGLGVASFDGSRWVVYDEDDGVPWLASNIAVSDDGTVWVGTTSTWGPPEDPDSGRPADGIGRFSGTSWIAFTTDDGLLSNSGSIIVAPDGTVWVLHSALPGTYARGMGIESPPPGLSLFDGATWTSTGSADQGGGAGVVAADGTVWTVQPGAITGFRQGELMTFSMPLGAIPPEPPKEPDTALPYEYPAGGEGGVTVQVSGIEGAKGWRVGGVLFIGPNRSHPDTRAIGGFSTEIDNDSFSTTQVVTTPADDWNSAPEWETDFPYTESEFPYVSNETLGVGAGTYTLAVYVSNRLWPYSRWMPGCSNGVILYDLVETFEVHEGQSVEVEIEFDLDQQKDLCAGIRY